MNHAISLAISLTQLAYNKPVSLSSTPFHRLQPLLIVIPSLALDASVTASVYDSLSLPQSAAATQIAPINTPAFSFSLHFRLI